MDIINLGDIPKFLPILPLRNSVFFPGGVLPLAIGRAKSITLIQEAVRDDLCIGVVAQRRADDEDPGADGLYAIGTVARIVKLLKMGEANYSLVVQGLARFRMLELVQGTPYLKARVEAVEDKSAADTEVEALGIYLKKLARRVIEVSPELPAAAVELVESITHPGHLADLIAANVDVPIEEQQAVLETLELKGRMKLVLELLNRKGELLTLSNEIDARVLAKMPEAQREVYSKLLTAQPELLYKRTKTQREEMSRAQREYHLRLQLSVIEEELGEKAAPDVPSLSARIEALTERLRRLRERLRLAHPGHPLDELDKVLNELAFVSKAGDERS